MDEERHGVDGTGAMNVRENHGELGRAKDTQIDRCRRRDREIRVVGVATQGRHAGEILLQKGTQLDQRHRIDLAHDAFVVRRHHLSPVIKIRFESIVMRRIVARGDHDAGLGFQRAHRKTQLRRRPGAVENKGLATQSRPSRCRQFTKVPGKMAHVVRNHEFRPRRISAGILILPRVTIEPHHRPDQGEIVEHVAADGGMFRCTGRTRDAGFRRRRHDSDRTAAHPSRAELQVAVEPVVEFAPRPFRREFVDTRQRPRGELRREKGREVLRSSGHQRARFHCGVNSIKGRHGR